MTGGTHPSPRGGEAAPREQGAEVSEAVVQPPPRIYAASLSDYNAGRLHGAWLDADQSAAELATAIANMLAASPEPGAEEWAIHDFEGFGAWRPSEWERLDAVVDVAEGIRTHGLAYAAWRDWNETAPAEDFQDDFLGEWPSMLSYAESLTDDMGLKITVDPPSLERYVQFDHEQFARDLEGDLHARGSPDGGVWLFQYRT